MIPKQPVNNSLLNALRRKPCDYTPVWVMRQAGRYLPEYRKLRSKAGSFKKLCKTPELAAQATLQPLARYDMDAAILFSDILTIPDAMGLELRVEEGIGPIFDRPIRTPAEVSRLAEVDFLSHLDYVGETVERVSANIDCSLIGFAGSPWTLASYMIQSQSSNEQRKIREWRYTHSQELKELILILEKAVTQHLILQLTAGAHAVMIFDSWGGCLDQAGYIQHSFDPINRICENVKKTFPEAPVIVFARGVGSKLNLYRSSKADALAIDWTCDIKTAQLNLGDRLAIQGNLEPACLLSDEKQIRLQVRKLLDRFGAHHGHVFNLGHGIWENVPPKNLGYMVDEVHQYSRYMRSKYSFKPSAANFNTGC